MHIFGAKSRAARGCASKLACGRRIDPCGGHIRFYDTLRQICDCPSGGQGRPPLRVHSFPHRCTQFCNCIPPYGTTSFSDFPNRHCCAAAQAAACAVTMIIPPIPRRSKTPPAIFPAPAPPRPQGARPFAPARPRRCCRSGSRGAVCALRRSAPPPPPCAG